MFQPTQYDSGKLTEIKMVASVVVAKGDALAEDGNGYYQRATSAAAVVRYVAQEDRTDDSTHQYLLVVATLGVRFVADTVSAPTQTQVGTTADLTDHDTLNNAAVTNDVFFIEEIFGPAADQKVVGYFLNDKATA